MRLIIEQATAQAVVDYLAKQPYNQVVNLIPAMTRLEPYQEPSPAGSMEETQPPPLVEVTEMARRVPGKERERVLTNKGS